MCCLLAAGELAVTVGVPSPKSNRYVAIGVRSASVEPEASAFTVSAGEASCVTESEADGGFSACTVMLAVAGAEARFAVSVAISVTV